MALKYTTRTIWLLLLINTRQRILADLVECDLESQFRCKSADLCISSDLVQNGIPDCPDGSDEECQNGEYACSCGTPQCISKDLVLDGVPDCADGSDEGLSLPCYQEEGLQELLALERRKRSASNDSGETFGSINPASPSFQRAYSTQVVGERPDIPDVILNTDESFGEEMDGKVISMLEDDANAEVSEEADIRSIDTIMEVKEIDPAKPQAPSLATIRAGESLLAFDDEDEMVAKEGPKPSDQVVDNLEGSVVTEYTTTRILGFADFSTTIGSTVVVFSPNAAGPAFGDDMMSSIMMKISSTSKAELPARKEEVKVELTTSASPSTEIEESVVETSTATEILHIATDLPEVIEPQIQQKADESKLAVDLGVKAVKSMLDNELPTGRSLNTAQTAIPIAPAVVTALSEKEARSLNFATDHSFVIVAAEGDSISAKESSQVAQVFAKEFENDELVNNKQMEELTKALSSDQTVIAKTGEESSEPIDVKQPSSDQPAVEELFSPSLERSENVSEAPITTSDIRTTREQPTDPAIENSFTSLPTSSPNVILPSITTEYTTYTVFKTLFNEETSKVLTKFTTITNIMTIDNLGHQVAMTKEPVPEEIVQKTTQTFFMSTVVDGKTAITSSTEVLTSVMAIVPVKAIEKEEGEANLDLQTAASFEDMTDDLQTEETTEIETVEGKAITITPSPVIVSEVVLDEEKKANVMTTTLTYATTFFRDGKTEVVTSEEVVTNTVSGNEKSVQSSMDLAITYYTTYTYSTTTISDGATYINTREETVSNIVTPTIEAEKSVVPPVLATQSPAETTFITTYTYYTTSFLGDDAIVESSFETITNIVTSTPTPLLEIASAVAEQVPVEEPSTIAVLPILSTVEAVLDEDNEARAILSSHGDQEVAKDKLEPTGLISVLSRTVVNEGITTKFVTDIIGTYINGFYAEIHESTSEVIKPTAVVAATGKTAYSQKVESAYDIGGATTTYFTTHYYASGDDRLVESTSTFRVNLALLGAAQEASRTGLLRIVQGTGISGIETTVYETRYIGKNIDGSYATITESTSNIALPSLVVAAPVVVEPTVLAQGGLELQSSVSNLEGSLTSTTSSPVESSIVEEASAEISNKFGVLKGRVTTRLSAPTKSRTFTPAIRPLNSRSRPVFSAKIRNNDGNSQGVESISSEESVKEATPVRKPIVPVAKPIVVAEEETVTTPKNKFFRPRQSSATGADVTPTPVISRPSFTVPVKSRTVTPFRRPFGRPSAEKETVLQDTEETTRGVDNDLEKTSTTETVLTTTRRSFTRAPTPAAVSNDIGLPQRRNFPLRKPAPANDVVVATEQKPSAFSDVTTRPRFFIPPKLVFTEKLEVPNTDNSFRQRLNALRNRGSTTTTSTTQEPPFRDNDDTPKRAKRYAPDLYRPGRAAKGRAREIAPSFEYEYEYEYYDDTPSTTKAPAKTTRTTTRPTTQRKTTSNPVSFKSRLASVRSSTPKATDSVNRFRKPAVESSSTRSTFRPSSSKSRTTTSRTTGRKVSSSSKKGSSNKVRVDETKETVPSIQPSLADPKTITVTHKVPTETAIPVVENGQTVFRNVITATPSLEILSKLNTIKVNGVNRLLASEISVTPSVGLTEITQYLVRSSEIQLTDFTPTVINGRKTSFRHIIPSTVYEIETTTSSITDPIAQTNFLLQQILLGRGFPQQIPQQQPVNPLQNLLGGLPLNQPLGLAPAEPVTSFSTRLSSYVTSITEFQSTVLPITLRGIELKTTLLKSFVNVVTATEVLTETIVSTPVQQAQPTANPFANLLPLLLANQAGLQQPVQTQIAQLPLISQPQSGIAKVSEIKPEQVESLSTSVVTLHVAGPTGELSTVLHTVVYEGNPSPVTKRQAVFDAHEAVPNFVVPVFVETDKGIFVLPDRYDLKDIDVYVMSAINNEVVELGPVHGTDALDSSILKSTSDKVKRQSSLFEDYEDVSAEELLSAAQFEFPPIREREYVDINREPKANQPKNTLPRVSQSSTKSSGNGAGLPVTKEAQVQSDKRSNDLNRESIKETPTPRKTMHVSVIKRPVADKPNSVHITPEEEEEEYYDSAEIEYDIYEETDVDHGINSKNHLEKPIEAEITTFRNTLKLVEIPETEHNSLEEAERVSSQPETQSQTEKQTSVSSTETLTKEVLTEKTMPLEAVRQSKKVSVKDPSEDSDEHLQGDLTVDETPIGEDETLKSNILSSSFGERTTGETSTVGRKIVHVPIKRKKTEEKAVSVEALEVTTLETTHLIDESSDETPTNKERKTIYIPIKRKKTEESTTSLNSLQTTTEEGLIDQSSAEDSSPKNTKAIRISVNKKKIEDTTSAAETTTQQDIAHEESSIGDESYEEYEDETSGESPVREDEKEFKDQQNGANKKKDNTVEESRVNQKEEISEPVIVTTQKNDVSQNEGQADFRVTTFRSNLKISDLIASETSSEEVEVTESAQLSFEKPANKETTVLVTEKATELSVVSSVAEVETTEVAQTTKDVETTAGSPSSDTKLQTTTEIRASDKDIFKKNRETTRGRSRFTVTTTERNPVSTTERQPSARKISIPRKNLEKSSTNPEENVPQIKKNDVAPAKPAVGIFDPRTYLTVYSYLYTVFDPIAPGSQISTRLVTTSEIARGKDKKLPSDFSRTETSSGLYTIKTATSVSDLGFTVDADGVTTSTQLSSNILVRYGRGKINVVPPSKVESTVSLEKPLVDVSEPEGLFLIEPSFVSVVDISESDISVQSERPKVSLPRRFTVSTVNTRSSALPSTGSNRGRGTVRFGASLKDSQTVNKSDEGSSDKAILSNVKPLRSFNKARGQSKANELDSSREARVFDDVSHEKETTVAVQTSRGRSRFRQPEPRKIDGPPKSKFEELKPQLKLRGRTRLPATTESFRQVFRGRQTTTTEEPELEEEYEDDIEQDVEEEGVQESGEEYVDEGEIHEDRSGSNEIRTDESAEHTSQEYDEEVVYDEEPEHQGSEEAVDANEDLEPASVQESGEQQDQPSESLIEPSTTAVESLSVKATRTFTFRRRDPLEKHLSSIRANANRRTLRPNLKIGKQTVSNIAPTTDRLSTTSTRRAFRPSNVVHKSFFITSTVPLHGGKKNVKLTLLTSTLTTLLEADLHLTTDSPEIFNPLLKSETRFRRPTKLSTVISTRKIELATSTSVDRFEGSGGIDLEYSTELIETSFTDIGLEPVPVTETPELAESAASGLSDSVTPEVESVPSSTTETPQLEDDLSFVTVTETELRTYSVVVTSVAGTEQVVSTGIEVVPEEVVKTITLGFKSGPDMEEVPAILDQIPTARFAGSGPVHLVDGSGPLLREGVRTGRVSVGASRPNLSTKVMSNGVEVIVAGDKKKPIIEALTSDAPTSVESSVAPVPVDEEDSSVLEDESEVGPRIDSSIDEPVEFTTRSKLTTLTYASTLFQNNQLVTSIKEEVITEIVTERKDATPLDLKTYFVTETKTLTTVVNGQTMTKTELVVATEVVPNESASLDGSLNESESDVNDLFDDDGPIIVTKTFFTTSTIFTTISLDGQTLTKSRIEVASNIVEETITDGLAALKESLFGTQKPSGEITPTPVMATKTLEPVNPAGSPVVPNEAQLQLLKETFLATSTTPASDTELEPSQIFEYDTTEADVAYDDLFVAEPPNLPLLGGTRPLAIQPIASISILLEPTVALGFGGAPQEVAAGATVLAVSNAGSVVVVPTDVVTTTSSPGNAGSGGGLSNLLTIPSLSAIGTLGLSAIAQSLASNGGGGLNIQLGPVFNAVNGLLTGGLPFANKRNDTESRTDINIEEPKFIPVGAIARPEPRIPLQGVPLVPNAPGSPLLRPGANVDEFRLPVAPPGVPVATPNVILVHDTPQQANRQLPQPSQDPKRPVLFPQGIAPAQPDQPRQLPQGQLPPLFPQDPSRPLVFPNEQPLSQPAARPPLLPVSAPFDGKPGVPPSVVPGSNLIERQDDPAAIAPVIFKPVEDPRKPIPVPGPGSIVPGPNGPVRLVPVVGGKPPPGVEGTVFIRPVPETPSPGVRRVDTVPPAQVVQPSRDLPNAPSMVPFIPSVVTILPSLSVPVPNVQTIASIEGDNKIVRTNIISNGKTIIVEPTDSGRIRPSGQVVFPSAGLVLFPDDTVTPTPVLAPATIEPNATNSEEDEDEDTLIDVEVEGEQAAANVEGEQAAANVEGEQAAANVEGEQTSSEAPQVEDLSPVEEYEYETETEQAVEAEPASEKTVSVVPSTTTEQQQISVEPEPVSPELTVVGKEAEPEVTEAPVVTSEETFIDSSKVDDAEESGDKKEDKLPNDEVNDNMTLNNFAEEVKNIIGTVPESASEESIEVDHSSASPQTPVKEQSSEEQAVQPSEDEIKVDDNNKEMVEDVQKDSEDNVMDDQEHKDELTPEIKDTPHITEKETEVEPVVTTAPVVSVISSERATDVPPVEEEKVVPEAIPDEVFEVDDRDNEISKQDKGQLSALEKPALQCKSECLAKNNEFCDVVGGVAKCVCKRGFARLSDSAVCERALTYNVSMILEALNGAPLEYSTTYEDKTKPRFLKLSNLVKRGVESAFSESRLANDFRGAELIEVKQAPESTEGIRVDVLVHVKADRNISAELVQETLANEVERTDFNVDGETIEPARQQINTLIAEDFDECLHDLHDCPSNAECVNLKGTFTCQCKEGYEDLNFNSTDVSLRGRVCAGAIQTCKECNFAGSCKYDAKQNFLGCECREWYSGETCNINLKVLMIALVTIGAILLLLISCIILICCIRSRRAKGAISSGPSFLRYRGPGMPAGTLDRAAIIRGDTSSESSGGGLDNHGHTGDKSLRSTPPSTTTSPVATLQSYRPYGEGVGMLIPRAKHQHVTSYPTQPNLALTPEELAAREHQLIEYLEKGRGKRARLPSSARSTLERPPHSTFRRGSDSGLTGRSRSIDALSNVSESVHGDRISEVRSYDETTVRPAVKTPPYRNTKYEVRSRKGTNSRHGASSRARLYKPSNSPDDSSQFDSL